MSRGPAPEPTVSVVVNNYNYERYLGEAIESALAQTHPKTEVVVVDDGSKDGSRAVISRYGDRVNAVLKENGGQGSAFNAGFRASRGDVVIFLDADDYLYPEAAERVAAAFGPGVACVQYRLGKVDASGAPIGFQPNLDKEMESGEVWRTLLEKGHYRFPPTSGNAFSRAALGRILPMPEAEWRISADGYLAVMIPFEGSIRGLEEPLAAYRIHGSNLWMQQDTRDTARLASRVRHDLQKQELLERRASGLGLRVPKDSSLRSHNAVQYRLASLRLGPERHPVPSDTAVGLAFGGARSAWRYSGLPVRRRIALAAWFFGAGLLPRTLARRVISWGLNRPDRPKLLQTVLEKTLLRGGPAQAGARPYNP